MIELKWIPAADAVSAEVQRQAGHRAEIAALDAQIKALQARKSEVSAALDKRPGWAGDYGWFTARQQLRTWEAAVRSPHPLYMDGERVREARSGCLYDLGSGSGSRGERFQRDGDKVLMRGLVLRPVTREEAAEVAAALRGIVAWLDEAPDAP